MEKKKHADSWQVFFFILFYFNIISAEHESDDFVKNCFKKLSETYLIYYYARLKIYRTNVVRERPCQLYY